MQPVKGVQRSMGSNEACVTVKGWKLKQFETRCLMSCKYTLDFKLVFIKLIWRLRLKRQ